MNGRDTEGQFLEKQARMCRALTDPKRLAILDALSDRELSVGEIVEAVGASLTNVSQHLSVLRGSGLVKSRRERTSILYSLVDPEIMVACRALRSVLLRQMGEQGRLLDLARTGQQ